MEERINIGRTVSDILKTGEQAFMLGGNLAMGIAQEAGDQPITKVDPTNGAGETMVRFALPFLAEP